MTRDRLGAYELIRQLATGGMARVYLARTTGVGGFERHVVLKTLYADAIDDPSQIAMLLDEARLVAALNHRSIAQVHEIGVADDGTYFVAMEYVHGETVRAVLGEAMNRGYRLPLAFALTVISAAAGLHHAHERRDAWGRSLGIVHRDVSPSNLITGYDGAVKLIDFGIARSAARTIETDVGMIKGKPGYMSPEQARGGAIDRRSDVFALGVVLFELTTQTRAFRGANPYETVRNVVEGRFARPTTVVDGYPHWLEEIVLTALAPDPADRFQDAAAMQDAIDSAAAYLAVQLDDDAITRVLTVLFGARPEPWLPAGRPR